MSKKKILIIEDEKMQVHAMDMKLSDQYELLLAYDGEEGLNMALEKHPDLIILDLVLPKMDGFKMFEELRKDRWGSSANVLVLTALSGREKDFIDKGNVEYIEKTDIGLDELKERVQKILES